MPRPGLQREAFALSGRRGDRWSGRRAGNGAGGVKPAPPPAPAHGLLFIRHAQSTWNAEGRWQGQTDAPLSPRGMEQAQALAELLRREAWPAGVARLVSSDLARAVQTADVIGRALGLTPELTAGLREGDAGAWSGLHFSEVEARWPEELARFRSGEETQKMPGGENRLQVRTRALAVLEPLYEDAQRRAVLVVSHGGVLRALCPGLTLGNAEAHWLKQGELGLPAKPRGPALSTE